MWRLLCIALLLGGPAAAAGLDEATVRPDTAGLLGKLLARAGFGDFGRSYALVVGISDFEDFSDLPTADDPVRIRDYLVEEAGFDHVHLLTGDKVTKSRLQELMLDEFSPVVGGNDRFLFYWSGHGHTARRGGGERGFLPLSTSRKDRISTMVSMEEIGRWDSFLDAHQVLYLLDSCFSGLVGATAQSDLAAITRTQLSGPARHVIAAGRGDEQTIAIDALGGSVFTHALLKGLRGEADAGNALGRDNLVSVGELQAYLGQEVTRLRTRYGWEKSITPQIRDLRGADGAFFFPIPAAFPAEPAPEASPGTASAEVKDVQEALALLGLDPGEVTGAMTLKTRTALILFQRAQGLAETGKIDPKTLDALPFALAAMVQPQGTSPNPGSATEPEPAGADGRVQEAGILEPCPGCPTLRRVSGGAAGTFVRRSVSPFWIAETETTRGEFRVYTSEEMPLITVIDHPPDCYDWTSDNRMKLTVVSEELFNKAHRDIPVACVNRENIARYLDWLNRDNDGPPYRLPTEAELQYLRETDEVERAISRVAASRTRALVEAGAMAAPPEGLKPAPSSPEAELCEKGNFADASSPFSWRNRSCDDGYSGVAPVASYPADIHGLHDIAGNLWEWVSDCWREDPLAPATFENCKSGMVKGASFDDPVDNTTPEVRQPVPLKRRQTNIGFRIARDAE